MHVLIYNSDYKTKIIIFYKKKKSELMTERRYVPIFLQSIKFDHQVLTMN